MQKPPAEHVFLLSAQQRGLCPNEAESSKTSEADRRNAAAFVLLSKLQSSETIITLTSDACTQEGEEIQRRFFSLVDLRVKGFAGITTSAGMSFDATKWYRSER